MASPRTHDDGAIGGSAQIGSTRYSSRRSSKARAQVGDFAKSVTGAIGSVAKLDAGLGALAGGVAFVGTGKAISSLDSLAKTARKLKILPTPLVALRDAAKESGVDVKTLDMGLQRMLRRIQEAAKGKGEALPTLKELGLDASRLARMAPEKQFIAIARAMDRMKGDGQDLARAMKLFDSEGVDLVNTLRLVNERGLQPFIEAATRSGRAGRSLEIGLPNVERVKDSLTRLKDSATGIFDQMAIAAAPPLNNLLGRLERFLKFSGVTPKLFEKMRKAGFDASGWIDSFFVGRGAAGEFRAELEKLWEKFKEFIAGIKEKVTSEMGYMFYENFGVLAGNSVTTSTDPNFALFDNVQSDNYWSGSVFAPNPSAGAWHFDFDNGDQNAFPKSIERFAWAVRPGNVVAQAVPAPGTLVLLGAALGLLGLRGRARRRRLVIRLFG